MKTAELDKHCFYKPNVEPIKTELRVFKTIYPDKMLSFNAWQRMINRQNKKK